MRKPPRSGLVGIFPVLTGRTHLPRKRSRPDSTDWERLQWSLSASRSNGAVICTCVLLGSLLLVIARETLPTDAPCRSALASSRHRPAEGTAHLHSQALPCASVRAVAEFPKQV